jgi:hypothetical protein
MGKAAFPIGGRMSSGAEIEGKCQLGNNLSDKISLQDTWNLNIHRKYIFN